MQTLRRSAILRVLTATLAAAGLSGASAAAAGDGASATTAPKSGTPVAPAQTDAPLASALLRTAILVDDLGAARRFYVDGLGLKLRYEGDITRPAVAHQLGIARGQTAYFVVLDTASRLGAREVRSAMLGLLKVDHPSPPRVLRSGAAPLAVGESMLAIETTDIREVERRLRALGAPFVVEPHAAPDGSEIEMVIRDPVGTRVHVVQKTPASPAARP
jgi:catechol 2,3-dioxygenase-like lactoylglutathione lyase family enzyme